MPIYDNDGTTNYQIGKLYDNDGTASNQIGKVYDNNGTTSSLIYNAQTDLYSYGTGIGRWTLTSYTVNQWMTNPTRSAENNGDHVRLYVSGSCGGPGSPTGAIMKSNVMFDMTNYTKLGVVYKLQSLTAPDNSCVDVGVGTTYHSSYGYLSSRVVTGKLTTVGKTVTAEFDISAVSGSQYIEIRANCQSANNTLIDLAVYEIYLA